MKLCKDCKHSRLGWTGRDCHRNRREELDPVDGELITVGVIDCELARDPAYCENPSDPRYCGPEGRLWEAEDA